MTGEIAKFLEIYKADYDRNRELDEAVTAACPGYEEWEESFRNRSVEIRRIFMDSRENLERLKKILEQPLTEEFAGALFDMVQNLYTNYYDDLYIMKMICEPLIAFYTGKNDVEKLVYLYGVMAYENFEFYGRIAGEGKDISAVVDCYEKVISFAGHYNEIENQKIRLQILTAYSNMIAPIGQFVEDVRKKTFRYYEEAYALFESGVKPFGDKTRTEFMGLIDLCALALEAHLNELGPEDMAKFEDLVDRLEKDPEFEDSEGNLYRARQSLAIYKKEKSVEEVIEESIAYIKQLKSPDFENQEETLAFNYCINFFNSAWVIFELFDNFKVPKNEQIAYAGEFVDLVTRELTNVPYRFMTTTFNEVCSQWFTKAEIYLPTFEKKRQLLFDMILCRQPATYIHSLMVKELAVAIAGKMLEEDTDFFDGALMTSTEKLLAFIGDCALMHDIGKCAIADVINKQARSLSDYEFDIIKLHPQKALQIINNDPDFLSYMDVMLGHHKSYDGKSGYPKEFDNQSSEIAPVIDLITICDAMDAATDIYGRNYTSGKNFDTLYGELVEGKGSRYCPRIVDFIGEHEDLYGELKDLTENRRGGIYFHVYQDITNIKSKIMIKQGEKVL